MPFWVNILEVAEAWGVPPWEVAGAALDNRAVWYYRQMAWSRARNKRADTEDKKVKRG